MDVEDRKKCLTIVREFLTASDDDGARQYLATIHPSDISMVFEALDEPEMVCLFRLLEPEVASEVFLEVDERLRESLISVITDNELVDVVDEMETDDAADIINELPHEDARKVLEGIDEEESKKVQKLLRYAEDTAGGKMQAELVSVNENATVDETIEEVRKLSAEVDNISNVFVVSSQGELKGSVSLDKLILAESNVKIKKLVDDRELFKVTTDLDQEEVGRIFKRYDLLTLPVVDHLNKLVGRITVDDVVDVIEDEIFEDFYRMASLNIEERALDSPVRSFRMRSPWLLLNLITAFCAASVVMLFQSTIEAMVILAVMMPIVAGLGGNAATQTITVVIRGLALGELTLANTKKLIIKEAIVGISNGLLVGAVAGGVAYIFGGNIMLGVVIFLSITANLFIAAVGGATIPMILKWLKIDPALSSSVFVTTCTDIGGFFTFLGLATLFMKLGLL